MPSPSSVSANSYRSLVFAVLASAYMLVIFHRLCPAVVAVDMMRDLNAGGGLLGMLSGAYFYSYAAMQLPAGLLADSWGARRTTTAFYLAAAAGALCMGLAPDAAWATGGRVLVGLGMSMIWVCTLKTLAEWYPPSRFAAMTGMLVAAGGLGSLLSSAPLAWAAQTAGWRNAFIGLGILSAAMAGVLWTVVRDTPAQAGCKGPDLPHSLPPGRQALMPGVRLVLANRRGWLVAAWLFLDNGIFFSFAGLWAGPFLKHVHGFDQTGTGGALAMVSLGLITGGPLLPAFSTHVMKSRKKTLILCASALTAILTLLAARFDSAGPAELHALFFLFGIFGGAAPAVAFTSAKELYPVSLAGTALGIMNIFPFAGGAVFQPALGLILEHWGRAASGGFTHAGYRAMFMALAASSVLLLAVCAMLTETWRGRTKPAPRR